jgi:monovalent cation:H+ antiporter-2, CPA2 family
MASALDMAAYKDGLIVLTTAAVIVPLVNRLKFSPILGFLAAGIVLGPKGLGALTTQFPYLDFVTVTGEKQITAIAELGIVFLLFLIGLELSPQRLLTMRRLVFGLGGLQILVSTAALGAILIQWGLSPGPAVIIGASLSLSSTAIVVELLSRSGRISTTTGRASFAVLIAQDIAVVPLLFLVGVVGGEHNGPLWLALGLALGEGILAIVAIVIVGRVVLKPLFRLVAAPDNPEFFIAATILVAVGTGVASAIAGLSMALGAFVAGLVLAETEYRRAIEVAIEPFKSLLLGVFFFSVGMSIDPSAIWHSPLLIIAGLCILIVVKAFIAFILARLFKISIASSLEAAFLLAPGGEFAFIVIAMALDVQLVKRDVAELLLTIVAVSMAALPFLAIAGRHMAKNFVRAALSPEALTKPPSDLMRRAIVVGHGRVGQVVCDMLDRHKVPYLATDRDAGLVTLWRQRGRDVFYGDASNPLFLKSCGIDQASAVIITIHVSSKVRDIVKATRALRDDIIIVARARDAAHARELYAAGVTDAVPETIEASLQLSEAALVDLGVPTGFVIASVHEKRDEFRHELQEAARAQGARDSRGIRPKR